MNQEIVLASGVCSVPYLTSEAECPYCKRISTFQHIESFASSAKPKDIRCGHAYAFFQDNDGLHVYYRQNKFKGD